MLLCEACPSPHPVSRDECDADHHHRSFASIRDAFLEERGITLADVRISEENGLPQLADEEMREAFRRKHEFEADLRIICKPEHRRQNREVQRQPSCTVTAQKEGEISTIRA